MKKIKRIIVILGIIFLVFMLQINISKIYARPDDGDNPGEIASAMYQYTHDKVDETLSTLNMGWLLNEDELLNSSDIGNYIIDENRSYFNRRAK